MKMFAKVHALRIKAKARGTGICSQVFRLKRCRILFLDMNTLKIKSLLSLAPRSSWRWINAAKTSVNEAVPQTPNPTKTVHVHRKGRETCKRTKPDGTVEEVTREFEEDLDIPADVWVESEKKKPKTDQPDNAVAP